MMMIKKNRNVAVWLLKHLFRWRKNQKLAGAVGFKPTNAGSKIRFLTEKRKKNGGLLGYIF